MPEQPNRPSATPPSQRPRPVERARGKAARRRALVDAHMSLAHAAAQAVHRSVRGAIDLDDLIAFATVGLLQAANRYDEARAKSFAGYAYPRIRGAIFDGIREIAPLPSSTYRATRGAMPSRPRPFVTSLDAHLEAGHQVADPTSPCAEDDAQHSELCGLLSRAIDGLSARERALVLAHYFRDQPLERAGNDLGISKSWASRLHAQALDHLRSSMKPARLAA